MNKERVVLFLDFANINRAAREKKYRMDYHHLLQYAGEGRFLLDAHCYVPIDPRNEHRLDGVIEDLWGSGYIVTTKLGTLAGGTYKCNFDVEITMDVLRVVYQMKPDIIVLASGDSDFVPLILEVRKSGVRVEVAAFEETVGANVLSKCSGFINLAVYYESYLTAQNGKQDERKIEGQYKDLIQSQNGEMDEESTAKEDQNALQQKVSDLIEDEEKLPIDQVSDEPRVPASDMIDDLEL